MANASEYDMPDLSLLNIDNEDPDYSEHPFNLEMTDDFPSCNINQPPMNELDWEENPLLTLLWIEEARIPSDVKDQINEVEAIESFNNDIVITPLAIMDRSDDHVVNVGKLFEPPVMLHLKNGSGPVKLIGAIRKVRMLDFLEARARAEARRANGQFSDEESI